MRSKKQLRQLRLDPKMFRFFIVRTVSGAGDRVEFLDTTPDNTPAPIQVFLPGKDKLYHRHPDRRHPMLIRKSWADHSAPVHYECDGCKFFLTFPNRDIPLAEIEERFAEYNKHPRKRSLIYDRS